MFVIRNLDFIAWILKHWKNCIYLKIGILRWYPHNICYKQIRTASAGACDTNWLLVVRDLNHLLESTFQKIS